MTSGYKDSVFISNANQSVTQLFFFYLPACGSQLAALQCSWVLRNLEVHLKDMSLRDMTKLFEEEFCSL